MKTKIAELNAAYHILRLIKAKSDANECFYCRRVRLLFLICFSNLASTLEMREEKSASRGLTECREIANTNTEVKWRGRKKPVCLLIFIVKR